MTRPLPALLLLATLTAAAAEPAPTARDVNAWLAAEHLKLAERCLNADLHEEARAEFRAASAADPANAVARELASRGGRRWVVSWDDTRHEHFLDYRELRRILDYGASEKLLALGRALAAAGDVRGSQDAWKRAIQYDPDYEEGRKALGHERVDGQWYPKAEAEKRKQGLLPWKGGWLEAAEVTKRRSAWGPDAWEVAGVHVHVRSNHSEAAAREALAWAEDLWTVAERELSGVIDLPALKATLPVFLFATREDFDAHVLKDHPERVAKAAVGFYSSRDFAAHFWWRGKDGFSPPSEVVMHECLHQLMDATVKWKDEPTLLPGFWVMEGIARYFETIENRDGKLLTTGKRHRMFSYVRAALKSGDGVSLADLVTMTQEQMPGHYDAAGVIAHYFMHAKNGEYREKFLRYVKKVHAGEAPDDAFEKILGAPPQDFDGAWRAWAAEK